MNSPGWPVLGSIYNSRGGSPPLEVCGLPPRTSVTFFSDLPNVMYFPAHWPWTLALPTSPHPSTSSSRHPACSLCLSHVEKCFPPAGLLTKSSVWPAWLCCRAPHLGFGPALDRCYSRETEPAPRPCSVHPAALLAEDHFVMDLGRQVGGEGQLWRSLLDSRTPALVVRDPSASVSAEAHH